MLLYLGLYVLEFVSQSSQLFVYIVMYGSTCLKAWKIWWNLALNLHLLLIYLNIKCHYVHNQNSNWNIWWRTVRRILICFCLYNVISVYLRIRLLHVLPTKYTSTNSVLYISASMLSDTKYQHNPIVTRRVTERIIETQPSWRYILNGKIEKQHACMCHCVKEGREWERKGCHAMHVNKL